MPFSPAFLFLFLVCLSEYSTSFSKKIYLFIGEAGRARARERERERERERDLPSAGSLPRWLQQLELRRSKARSQEPRASSRSPTWVQGPKHLGQPLLLSQATAESWMGKWSSRDSNQCPYVMPALRAAALPAMPQHQPSRKYFGDGCAQRIDCLPHREFQL